ncbi:uncharacterized protein LOC112345778 [Selaginella moellendorffii]|uniref:uncharacterized protein LOC112345778 n=1 Tax=Selaginella moellendorffii TaxID=88036 RepID=UPI000D1CD1D0|nr:uncharacterized protein LOC112345778 [Selaginella moellendorffii]|eukprot:XP_024528925.1 uncharacterized protein LOC112345778 [Selaginella moellendorffii]
MVQFTNVLQIVKKITGGLVWKKWKMNDTRKANRRRRLIRIHQVEAIIKACKGPPPPKYLGIPAPSPASSQAAAPPS